MRRRHKGFSGLKWLFFTLIPVILFAVSIVFALHTPIQLKQSKVVQVPAGYSVSAIGDELKKQGVLRSTTLFKIYIKFNSLESAIRSGYFQIPKRINTVQLVRILSKSSGAYYLEKVTIPEGFSVRQIADRLGRLGLVDADDFFNYVSKDAKDDFKEAFPFLNFDSQFPTLEGYLFPETYFFSKSDGNKGIVRSMLRQFERVVLAYYESIDYKGKLNFHQLVTMASLIEKESRIRDEMPTISSVFHNRLERTIRLRTDPTVVYALGLTHKERVYYKDLEVDSPYNTYRRVGLPPTGIASPGLKAFKAACFPASTPYLFFVALPDGSHHFSRTYEEHLRIQRVKK